MPPHQHDSQQGMQEQRLAGQPQNIFSRISDDIKALNTTAMVLTQKINSMVRYEKILGRNLIVLGRKVRELQEQGPRQGPDGQSVSASELAEISRLLGENAKAMARIQSELDYIRQNYAKAEDVKEVKYVVESINPMEFATLKDLHEALGGKKKK